MNSSVSKPLRGYIIYGNRVCPKSSLGYQAYGGLLDAIEAGFGKAWPKLNMQTHLIPSHVFACLLLFRFFRVYLESTLFVANEALGYAVRTRFQLSVISLINSN